MTTVKNPIIISVIDHFGGQAKMADLIGIKQGGISNWLNNKNGISERNALKIEKLTNGKFRAVDLCPRLAELDQITNQQKNP